MKTILKTMVVSLLTFPLIGNAATRSGLSVNDIRAHKDFAGLRSFKVNNGQYLETGCPNSDALVSGTPDGLKAMLSILLTARTAGLTVTVDYTIINGYCYAESVYLE